jgi:hypothetical protein
MAPPPQMGAQGMAPPPQMGGQGMAPPPQMGGQGMAPPPQMGGQGMAPPPQMGGQGMAPPPQIGGQGMAPPPQMGGQGMAPLPQMGGQGMSPEQQKFYEELKNCGAELNKLAKPWHCCIFPQKSFLKEKRVICMQECKNPLDTNCRIECIFREHKLFDEGKNAVAQSFSDIFMNSVDATDPAKDSWSKVLPESAKKCVEFGKNFSSEVAFHLKFLPSSLATRIEGQTEGKFKRCLCIYGQLHVPS